MHTDYPFFFLVSIRRTQYNTFSFVLLSFFSLYREAVQQNLFHFDDYSLSLPLFLFDNVVSFCLPSTPRKSDRLYARSFFICSHRSTTKQEQHSSSVLNAHKSNKSKNMDDEDDNHSLLCMFENRDDDKGKENHSHVR